MQRLKGKQDGTFRYYYDGHVYWDCTKEDKNVVGDPRAARILANERRRSGVILRCARKNALYCQARIFTENLDNCENREFRVHGEHNHDEDRNLLLKEQFLEEVLQLAATTFESPRDIFNQVRRKPQYVYIFTSDCQNILQKKDFFRYPLEYFASPIDFRTRLASVSWLLQSYFLHGPEPN